MTLTTLSTTSYPSRGPACLVWDQSTAAASWSLNPIWSATVWREFLLSDELLRPNYHHEVTIKLPGFDRWPFVKETDWKMIRSDHGLTLRNLLTMVTKFDPY